MKKSVIFLLVMFVLAPFVFANGGDEAPSDEPVSLTVWISIANLKPAFEEAIIDFQKQYPGAEVEILTFPAQELWRKAALALSTGTAPDVLLTIPSVNLENVVNGYQDPAPSDVADLVNNQMFVDLAEKTTYEGVVYGVPLFYGNLLLYWNKQHFAEAGLPGPPKTWDEVIEYSQKLTKYDADGNVTRSGISLRLTNDGGAAGKFNNYLVMSGARDVVETAEGKWHSNYDNDAGRAALQLYTDLLWKYKVNSHTIEGDFKAFTNGNASMFMRGPFVVNYIANTAPDLDYDVAEPPMRLGGDRHTTGYMYALYVPETTDNKRAAWDYIKAVVDTRAQQKQMIDTGWPTARSDLDMSPVYDKFPQYKIFAETMGTPGYVLMYQMLAPTNEIQNKIGVTMSDAWLDPTLVDNPEGIAKVIAYSAAETDEIIKREGLYGK